jgi:hypothetical protein
MTEYKDQFTLDGRLKPAHPSVTRAKVAEADKLLKAALRGDKIASGQLAEVHTTSDLPFAIAHLITTEMLPQFDRAERTWSQVAGVRTVPSFENVRLQSMLANISGAGVATNGGLPVVPETAPYPYVTVSGREAFYAKIQKNGSAFGKSWESQFSDVEGFYENIPAELVQLALDTEEREVYEALATAGNSIAGGTLPDGTVVTANPTLTPNAIWQAIIELANVEVNGRKVGRSTNGYNVVVPIGVGDFINWKINQTIIQIQDGSITFGPGDRSAFNNVTVVETAYVTGDDWYILPKVGGIRRPVLELLRLRGYEAPELRANGNTGVYLGSSAVVPFNEGSWAADTIDYRIRYVAGGALWDDSFVLTSDSSES